MSESEKIQTKEEYILNALKSYEYFSGQAEFFKRIVENGGGTIDGNNNKSASFEIPKIQVSEPSYAKSKKRYRISGTFADAVIKCLEAAGKPQFTGELMDKVKDFGRTVSTSSNFGSQLNSAIKTNLELNKSKIGHNIVWGLADWFENGNIKDEYMTELLARIKE